MEKSFYLIGAACDDPGHLGGVRGDLSYHWVQRLVGEENRLNAIAAWIVYPALWIRAKLHSPLHGGVRTLGN